LHGRFINALACRAFAGKLASALALPALTCRTALAVPVGCWTTIDQNYELEHAGSAESAFFRRRTPLRSAPGRQRAEQTRQSRGGAGVADQVG